MERTPVWLPQPTRRAVLGAVLVHGIGFAKAEPAILNSVKSMEADEGLMIAAPYDFDSLMRRRQAMKPFGATLGRGIAVSPDGTDLCWGVFRGNSRLESLPFLIVESLGTGLQPVWLEGQDCAEPRGISVGAQIIVAKAIALARRGRWTLLALDLRTEMKVYDLSPFLTEFEVPEIEDVSVSSSGSLTAVGSRKRVQVLRVPSGDTVLTTQGWIPRLSPDGKRLAFINDERLFIRSLADNSTSEPLADTRVMGVGGWSPNGRYLLAGAWTRLIALEKRQIVVDTVSGDYAIIGRLHEGDYGTHVNWISAKLLV